MRLWPRSAPSVTVDLSGIDRTLAAGLADLLHDRLVTAQMVDEFARELRASAERHAAAAAAVRDLVGYAAGVLDGQVSPGQWAQHRARCVASLRPVAPAAAAPDLAPTAPAETSSCVAIAA